MRLMYLLALLMEFVVVCFSGVTWSHVLSSYRCENTRFGEQLPVRWLLLKNESIKDCGDLCAREQVVRYVAPRLYKEIPESWIAKQVVFNSHLVDPAALPSGAAWGTSVHPVKRFVYHGEQGEVFIFETRYIDYSGFGFTVELRCQSGPGKNQACYNEFVIDTDSKLSNPHLRTKIENSVTADGSSVLNLSKLSVGLNREGLEDHRSEVSSLRAELMFETKNKNRLLVRVMREMTLNQNPILTPPVSASAEVMMGFEDTPNVSLDVGADEFLIVDPNQSHRRWHRLEAVEFKLNCSRVKEKEFQ